MLTSGSSSLPPEILLLILDHLPAGALLSLRATSKALLYVITPQVFSHVHLNLSQSRNATENPRRELQCLQSLADPSSTIAPYVTTLYIASQRAGVYMYTSKTDASAKLVVRTVLSDQHLTLSISKLRNLKTVCWGLDLNSDPSDYLISTAGTLSSLPSLKTLMVNIVSSPNRVQNSTLPPFRDFKNLCTLSVAYSADIPRACLQNITAAINASPSLANLSISNSIWTSASRANSIPLHFFLQTSKPELLQLELMDVPLPSAGIREILSHRLQKLSVSIGHDVEFDWRRLWSALQETWITLYILKVSGMESAIDDMLRRMDTSQEETNRTSLIFWDEIIPHHRDFLTKLSVISNFENEWCYGPRAAAALWQCSSLRNLTISVCGVDLSWAEATLSRAREYKNIEFRSLEEPDGAPENCGAWILSDLNIPLEKLKLGIADVTPWPELQKRTTRASEVLLGIPHRYGI
jgi:hypothetical protein